MSDKEKRKKLMKGSKGQGQSQKPFGLTRVRDTRMPLGTGLMVTPTDPVVRESEDSLTNRKKKLLNKMTKVQSKEMGGEVMDMTKSQPVGMMDGGKVKKMNMGGVVPGRGGQFKGMK